MVCSCVEKMEIPVDAHRWNCKFLERKKKERKSLECTAVHSSFSMVGVRINHLKKFSLPEVMSYFGLMAGRTRPSKMILEIFRVLVVEFQ